MTPPKKSDTPTGTRPWRHLYCTKRWGRLRLMVLARQPVCQLCGNEPSTVVDHITPHKGDAGLFHRVDNLQGLCKRCHDSDKARMEMGLPSIPTTGPDGWPADASPTGEGGGLL